TGPCGLPQAWAYTPPPEERGFPRGRLAGRTPRGWRIERPERHSRAPAPFHKDWPASGPDARHDPARSRSTTRDRDRIRRLVFSGCAGSARTIPRRSAAPEITRLVRLP